MTNVCEKFANLHQLKFSTNVDVSKSKTKCIVFSNPVINTDNICPILLNNLPFLPYVREIKILATHCNLMVLWQKMLDVNLLNLFLKYNSLNQELHYTDTSTELRGYDIRGAKKNLKVHLNPLIFLSSLYLYRFNFLTS